MRSLYYITTTKITLLFSPSPIDSQSPLFRLHFIPKQTNDPRRQYKHFLNCSLKRLKIIEENHKNGLFLRPLKMYGDLLEKNAIIKPFPFLLHPQIDIL